MSQIQIRDIDNEPISLMNVRLALGSGDSDSAYDDKFSDFAGNLSFPVVLPSNSGYTLHVNKANVMDTFESTSVRVNNFDLDLVIVLKRVAVPRAQIDGYFSNVFLKGESAFLDLYRLILGQDIKPLLRQSVDLGSNGRRNFFMTFNTARAAGLPEFNPDNHPDYFNYVEQLLNNYSEYGIYLYSCIFPDNGLLPNWTDKGKQRDHWNRLGEIAKRYSNWYALELTNEINSKTFNQVDQDNFSPIPGVICCRGSWTDDGGTPLSYKNWEMADFHQRRNYPKSVVDAALANYPVRESLHIATMLGESVGFGSGANRETNPRIAKEIAGTGRGTACGIIYHSTHGAFSQLYDQVEMDCAEAWFNELT